MPVDCAIKFGPRGCGKLTNNSFFHEFYIISRGVCYLLKKNFWWLLRRVKNLPSTACKHYWKCDVICRYLHIELIWCLLMVQYLQNNVIMKWTTRFIRFTGWIPLKYGSTTTPPIIAHCQKTPMSSLIFHIAIPKTSNIRCTPSFDLLTDEFSKRVSIIRRALSGLKNSIGPIARYCPKWPSGNRIWGPKLPAKLVFWKFGQ